MNATIFIDVNFKYTNIFKKCTIYAKKSDEQNSATCYSVLQCDSFDSISNSLAEYMSPVFLKYFVNGCIL